MTILSYPATPSKLLEEEVTTDNTSVHQPSLGRKEVKELKLDSRPHGHVVTSPSTASQRVLFPENLNSSVRPSASDGSIDDTRNQIFADR